jgi:putative glycosyltransferase (TIGR04348 family)
MPASYPSSLRIAIVCPAPAGSRLGNRITALRWQEILVGLGHAAEIVDDDVAATNPSYDLLLALHAGKSARAVRASRTQFPDRPIIVALTGTDLYRDILVDDAARASLDLADELVVLHDVAPLDVPPAVRDKVHVIRQSADPPPSGSASAASAPFAPFPPLGRDGSFDIAFVAHARAEKDPLRAALAARLLPATSRIRIVHAGRALSSDIEAQLTAEASTNSRYVWLGELTPDDARTLIAHSRLAALTSEIEGGANVLGEAVIAGTPPIASRIPACVAALGADYPGLFPAHDTAALAALLARAENDDAFYDDLRAASRARRELFLPSAEESAWRALLDSTLARARSRTLGTLARPPNSA